MKITVTKGKEKINIDSHCLPAWEKAGWKKQEENAQESKKASK